jgi:hypothetical protein
VDAAHVLDQCRALAMQVRPMGHGATLALVVVIEMLVMDVS